jgi:hypothetical protein
VCELTGIKSTDELVDTLSPAELLAGDYSPGRWGWILEDVRPVIPFKARGCQSLWSLAHSDELVLEEVGS